MVRRARERPLDYVVVKYGYPHVERAFAAAGIRWATERFVYPEQPEAEAKMLADAVDAGAAFAVINAEDWVGWSAAAPMERLVSAFRRWHPTVELYASIDSRGHRSSLPFMGTLRAHVTAWMPMVYPWDFEQPVATAFAAALDGLYTGGKPVLPTIETYPNSRTGARPGAAGVEAQVAEVRRRGLPGYNIYTLGHATAEEWLAVVHCEEGIMGEELKEHLKQHYLDAIASNNRNRLLGELVEGRWIVDGYDAKGWPVLAKIVGVRADLSPVLERRPYR
jgi:hypothetical protein